MEVERLSFVVNPEDRVEEFLDADAETWDPWLRTKRGFLSKTYQRYDNGRVDIRIFWATQRDWDAAGKDPMIPYLDVVMRSKFLGTYDLLPNGQS